MNIKELAQSYGVSDTAVHKRLKSLGLLGGLARTSSGYIITDEIKAVLDQYYSSQTKINLDKPNQTESNSTKPYRTEINFNHQTELNLTKPHQTEINSNKLVIEEQKQEITELKHKLEMSEQQNSALIQQIALLNQTISELKADKADLQQHRDNLTNALTVSKSDLARLENIVTKMAALPLATRIFKWTDTVAYLTEYESPKLDIVDVDIDE